MKQSNFTLRLRITKELNLAREVYGQNPREDLKRWERHKAIFILIYYFHYASA